MFQLLKPWCARAKELPGTTCLLHWFCPMDGAFLAQTSSEMYFAHNFPDNYSRKRVCRRTKWNLLSALQYPETAKFCSRYCWLYWTQRIYTTSGKLRIETEKQNNIYIFFFYLKCELFATMTLLVCKAKTYLQIKHSRPKTACNTENNKQNLHQEKRNLDGTRTKTISLK